MNALLRQRVFQRVAVVADAVQKLIGVEVSPSDIDAAISATLEERPQ